MNDDVTEECIADFNEQLVMDAHEEYMNLKQEASEELAHELRLRQDEEYAVEHTAEDLVQMICEVRDTLYELGHEFTFARLLREVEELL